MATSLTDQLTGRLLDGRYEIRRAVARGGMATVYEALDTRLERTVAIKVMHPELAADVAFVARFIREARSAARLSHPNVVAVYDQGSEGDIVYLAMEYVDGATLRDLLRLRGRLAPANALAIMEQVLSALAAAHKAGLIHRDVKPENVLLAEDGRVKVADFGLARAITVVPSGSLTTGVVIGTVSYLAPEQVQRSVADARSDVYAAGIVLFEMVTGEKPFTGATPMEVAFKHVHERVPAPSTRVPGIPVDIDAIVARATAHDPDDRPADAGELLAEVIQARGGARGLLDRAADYAEPTLRQGVALGAAPGRSGDTLVVGRAGTVTPGGSTLARADEPTDATPRKRNRRRPRLGWILFLVVLLLGAVAGGAGWWYAEGRFTVVPTVTEGTDRTSAVAALTRAGLKAEWGSTFSETVAPGLVVATDPPSGSRVLRGDAVTVSLSKGQERYEIPDLTKSTLDQAGRILDDLPLAIGATTEEYSETVAEGLVIRTDPAIGELVKRDTEISLVVSLGRQPIDIPTVEGESVEDAMKILTDAGFTPIEDEAQFHDTVAAGLVISQSEKDGQGFRGDEIHLVPSKGPDLIAVPSVLGKSSGDATQILTDAGFDVEIVRVLPEPLTDDVVIRQTPGGSQRRGTTITLYVI